jgi:small RNA 2'-O-methyltransferase
VLDLGCGSGKLLVRLLGERRFRKLRGVDISGEALLVAEEKLRAARVTGGAEWSLHHGSFLHPEASWGRFDAAVMVETIEHIAPESLSRLERAVFEVARPRIVLMTTPNREYNPLFGLAADELRDAEHRFEWCRHRFRGWAGGVAARAGYAVEFEDVGTPDPLLGGPTQMGVFIRA